MAVTARPEISKILLDLGIEPVDVYAVDNAEQTYLSALREGINTIEVASKDKKGNPTTFTLTLTIRIEVKNSMGEKKSKIFVENTSYDNDNNKFNLRKYENSIKNNMIETINENIILYLQDLN